MEAELTTNSQPVPSWLEKSPADLKIIPRNLSSQMTTSSFDTDFTSTTNDMESIITAQQQLDDRAIRLQYEQLPEKIPDIFAEMEKWFALTDRYGFLENGVFQFDSKLKEKEIERSAKWANMSKSAVINNETLYHFPLTEKFKKRVFKGIPDCWRREAWYFMITDRLQETTRDSDIQEMYHILLKKGSEHEHQIDLDIPRTLRGHIMFKQRYGSGQRSLFNVLRAFSNYDMEVGYCQGMTNVAATILMYCEEEKAFAVLVHMFLRDNLRNLYIPGFPTLMESFFIQESLLMRYLPKVSQHLTGLGLPSDAYSTRWYITLFTGGVVQYDTQLRIWDIYFLHGYDIFFFVVIVLFHIHRKKILVSDLDHCMEILGSTLSVPDNNKFMKSVEKLYLKNVRNDTIATLRRQYLTKDQ